MNGHFIKKKKKNKQEIQEPKIIFLFIKNKMGKYICLTLAEEN